MAVGKCTWCSRKKQRYSQKLIRKQRHRPGKIIKTSAYLRIPDIVESFKRCKWFTRGWTLQELLAPDEVVFYSSEWKCIGYRDTASILISSITGIDEKYIRRSTYMDSMHSAPICERMSWMARRKTTCVEDSAYCLLGLFEINMPLLYGEGRRAFLRLQEEIIRVSNDQTIFCWEPDTGSPGSDINDLIQWQSMLAPSPSAFRNSARFRARTRSRTSARLPLAPSIYTVTHAGLDITLPVMYMGELICVILDATAPIHDSSPDISTELGQVILFLRRGESGSYHRVYSDLVVTEIPDTIKISRARIFIACSGNVVNSTELLMLDTLGHPASLQILLIFDHHVIIGDVLQKYPLGRDLFITYNRSHNGLKLLPVPPGAISQFVLSGSCVMSDIGKRNSGDDDSFLQSFNIRVRVQHRDTSIAGHDTAAALYSSPIKVDISCIKKWEEFTESSESTSSPNLGMATGARVETELWRFSGSNVVACLVKMDSIPPAYLTNLELSEI